MVNPKSTIPELATTLLVGRAVIKDEDRILLVQRAHDDKRNPGMWEFPGGKIDANEDLMAGVVREVFEETGLVVRADSLVGYIENELVHSGKYEGYLYVALFYAAQRLSGDLAISFEHADAVWENPEDILSRNLTNESRSAFLALSGVKLI
jgi:8-oxo-dGTP diphosphatase